MNEKKVLGKTGENIADNVTSLIGQTPLVRLHRMPEEGGAEVLVKIEFLSPSGSIKDRVALNLIEQGEKAGLINHETVIVEPSSGNTGIGLAMMCASRGYRCIIVLPDSMSLERIYLLKRFGAEVVLTPAKEDIEGAVKRAEKIAKKHKNAFIPRQFENEWNPQAHRETTAREILRATGGKIDAFVAGVGTGGTITGVGEVLKQACPSVEIIAVEPEGSPVLSRGISGLHKIQGIGAGFVPKVLNREIVDRVYCVSDKAAFACMKRLSSEEGILAGLSSGAAVCVALDVAKTLSPTQRVVTILPDTGERYISTQHYFEF